MAGRHLKYAFEISTGTVGAICELQVCADLLARGWHVFRSVSPHAGCDLVAVGTTHTLLLEVRAATVRQGDGRLVCSGTPRGRYDVLAKVSPDGRVEYVPDMDNWEAIQGQLAAVAPA